MMDYDDMAAAAAELAAEELDAALKAHGLTTLACLGDEDGDVVLELLDIRDAELMLSLGIVSDEVPGSLYDRAASSCVSLVSFMESGAEPTREDLGRIMDAGWSWNIHPAMKGRRMSWHIQVHIPADDAIQVAANLNCVRLGATR